MFFVLRRGAAECGAGLHLGGPCAGADLLLRAAIPSPRPGHHRGATPGRPGETPNPLGPLRRSTISLGPFLDVLIHDFVPLRVRSPGPRSNPGLAAPRAATGPALGGVQPTALPGRSLQIHRPGDHKRFQDAAPGFPGARERVPHGEMKADRRDLREPCQFPRTAGSPHPPCGAINQRTETIGRSSSSRRQRPAWPWSPSRSGACPSSWRRWRAPTPA